MVDSIMPNATKFEPFQPSPILDPVRETIPTTQFVTSKKLQDKFFCLLSTQLANHHYHRYHHYHQFQLFFMNSTLHANLSRRWELIVMLTF
jgi:hypothetical protein